MPLTSATSASDPQISTTLAVMPNNLSLSTLSPPASLANAISPALPSSASSGSRSKSSDGVSPLAIAVREWICWTVVDLASSGSYVVPFPPLVFRFKIKEGEGEGSLPEQHLL